jgi:hypothetical protein
MTMTTDHEVIRRLDNIEAMLKKLIHDSSPSSLSIDEKARILFTAMQKGRKALKEAERQINGM